MQTARQIIVASSDTLLTESKADVWTSGKVSSGGFRHNAGMNSINHYAFGAVAEWMFQYMAGIQPLEAGFKKFRIRPELDAGAVGKVAAEYQTIHGNILSSWKKAGNRIILRVTVPVNTTAEVFIPGTTYCVNLHPVSRFSPVAEEGYT